MMDPKLKQWLSDDVNNMGVLYICENIMLLDSKLTFARLVTTGMLQMMEEQVKLQAYKLIKQNIPLWAPLNGRVVVISRMSDDEVITRAFFKVTTNDESRLS